MTPRADARRPDNSESYQRCILMTDEILGTLGATIISSMYWRACTKALRREWSRMALLL